MTQSLLSVALVGSGPVPEGSGTAIDSHDLVIRFNACRGYGRTGRKVDAIVLVNTSSPGAAFASRPDSIDADALAAASRFWLPKSPSVIAKEKAREGARPGHWQDHASAIVQNVIRDRPWSYFEEGSYESAQASLSRHGAAPSLLPSTGLLCLFHLRATLYPCKVTLFGFTHQGWDQHPWEAERATIAEWSDWISYHAVEEG